ncbi:hypothetical protein SAY86_028701 [Trapa natans]|uniref:Uncharacterized protein n=1 Tax=Trapa natans TaxID=22666 RepID=A0AAN7MFW6_TRANT|nr:hypothetical protein SAY86_028701 [Trapa natans]
MFRSLVWCGTGYGKEEAGEDEYDDDEPWRKQRRRFFFKCRRDRQRSIKNPYSGSGLGKFSFLMADLKEKREKMRCKLRQRVAVRVTQRSVIEAIASEEAGKNSGQVLLENRSNNSMAFLFNEAEPGLSVAAMVILVMILLAFFDKPVVILCSSAAWYIVPELREIQPNSRRVLWRKKQ